MAARLAHRGPDGDGVWSGAGVALAHRRLAVIDLSETGRQPMASPGGRYVIVFNGEIYNFCELRAELEDRGFAFRTRSDTEVLLHAYAAWGPEALEKAVGMFSFAVWDCEERSVFAARDRVGKKPFCYYWDGNLFAFASELKALRALPGVAPQLDSEAVDLYLALGYVPAPLSIFKNIRKLEPGHWLTLKDGRLSTRRYWRPEEARVEVARDAAGRREQFSALFKDSVRLRLRSDVPVGLFLSGGLDSSLVAAEAVAQGARPHALTVRFSDDETDLPYARRVAERLGLNQEVLTVDMGGAGALEDIVERFDEPFGDSSSVPTYLIARAMAGRRKVVLNGDGGDEAFAGYPHYRGVAWKQPAKALACRLGLKDGDASSPWQVYLQSKALFRRSERAALLTDAGADGCALGRYVAAQPFLGIRLADPLARALWADRHVYLPNDILFKSDMALGAFGLEGRSPFLDHRLLEWAQALGAGDLVRGGRLKVLLCDVARDQLPAQVADRPKHGFGAPVARWLEGPLSTAVREALPSPLLDAKAQMAASPSRVWTLLVFSLWTRHAGASW